MWDALNEICRRESSTVHEVCARIDLERTQSGLTAGVRVFILNYFRGAATEEGHARMSHGINGSGAEPAEDSPKVP